MLPLLKYVLKKREKGFWYCLKIILTMINKDNKIYGASLIVLRIALMNSITRLSTMCYVLHLLRKIKRQKLISFIKFLLDVLIKPDIKKNLNIVYSSRSKIFWKDLPFSVILV